jgi:hypothetical protein
MIDGVKYEDLTEAVNHLGAIGGSAQRLKQHFEAMEKAHQTLHECAKAHAKAHKAARATGYVSTELHKAHEAHMAAHESARLSRLGYKAEHERHIQKVADAIKAIHKVVGGGAELAGQKPESTGPEPGLKAQSTGLLAKGHQPMDHRMNSPFDLLRKNSQSAPRVFKNATNPMWTGRS